MQIVFKRTPGLIYDVYQALTMKLNDRSKWISRLAEDENKQKSMIEMEYKLSQLEDPSPELAVFFYQKEAGATNFFHEVIAEVMNRSDENMTKDAVMEYLLYREQMKEKLCQYYLGDSVDYHDIRALAQAIDASKDIEESIKFLLLSFYIHDVSYLENLRRIFQSYYNEILKIYEARANELILKQESFSPEQACARQEPTIRKRGRKKEIQKCIVSFVLFYENVFWYLNKTEEEVWFIIGDQYIEPEEEEEKLQVNMEKFGNALADQHRINIIKILLNEGEKSSAELAGRLNIAVNTVGYHVDIMKKAKLLSYHNQGKTAYYRINNKLCRMATWKLQEWILGEEL